MNMTSGAILRRENFTFPVTNARGRAAGLFSVALLGFLLLINTPASANIRLWTGNSSTSSNWSDPNNWNPVGVPVDGDDLAFPEGSARQSNFNDMNGRNFNTLTFSGTSLYVIEGITITLSNGINCDLTAGFADVDLPISLGKDQTFLGQGSSFMLGTVILSGHDLTLQVLTGCEIDLEGTIVGTGNIIKTGAGTGAIVGHNANTFQGVLEVHDGPFVLAKTNAVAIPNGLVIGDLDDNTVGNVTELYDDQISSTSFVDINHGTWDLNGFFESISNLVIYDGTTLTGAGTLTMLGTVLANGAMGPKLVGQPTINGNVFLPRDIIFYMDQVDLTKCLNLSGNASGPGGIYLDGGGTLTLVGTNTFTGAITLHSGFLFININYASLGNGSVVNIDSGGYLYLQNVNVTNKTLNFIGNYAAFEAFGSGDTWTGPINVGTNIAVINSGGGPSQGTPITVLELLGPIHGSGQLNLAGGTIEVTANNDFSGTVATACSKLLLNSPAGLAFAGTIDAGGNYNVFDFNDFAFLPVHNDPAEVRWSRSLQITGQSVKVETNGLINLNNFGDAIANIEFSGGTFQTGSGTATLTGNIISDATNVTGTLNGKLALSSAVHAFVISNGLAYPDLTINAVISGNAAIQQSGGGKLMLTAPNTFNSYYYVEQGLLIAGNDTALGGIGATTVFSGGTLEVDNLTSGLFAESLVLSGSGWDGTSGALYFKQGSAITSPIALAGSAVIRTDDTNTQTQIISTISDFSGPGSLTKTGLGTLSLAGSANNTYTGYTTNAAGSLYLSKSGATAILGNLVIGPGAPSDPPATVAIISGFGIGGDTVMVNANSLLNLNNNNQTLGHLMLNDGGDVQTGVGTLTLTADGTVDVGSQGFLGSRASSSITGKIGLPFSPNAFVTFNVGRYNQIFSAPSAPELDVPAAMSSGASGFAHGWTKNGRWPDAFGRKQQLHGRTGHQCREVDCQHGDGSRRFDCPG